MDEGETVVVTVTTTGLAQGTLVPFSIFGISSSDISQASSGNFTIGSTGQAAQFFTAVEDGLEEGQETMRVQINGQFSSDYVDIVINDTSVPAPSPTPSTSPVPTPTPSTSSPSGSGGSPTPS